MLFTCCFFYLTVILRCCLFVVYLLLFGVFAAATATATAVVVCSECIPSSSICTDKQGFFNTGTVFVQDERDSAVFNTRASVAIDRLGEQAAETCRRQKEMDGKRREKVRGR